MGALDFGEIRLDNGVITIWNGTTWKLLSDLLPGGGGGGGGASYVHNQVSAATVWTVNHNLGYQPNVSIIDSAGNNAFATIARPSLNQLTLTFSAAVGGVAYLS